MLGRGRMCRKAAAWTETGTTEHNPASIRRSPAPPLLPYPLRCCGQRHLLACSYDRRRRQPRRNNTRCGKILRPEPSSSGQRLRRRFRRLLTKSKLPRSAFSRRKWPLVPRASGDRCRGNSAEHEPHELTELDNVLPKRADLYSAQRRP